MPFPGIGLLHLLFRLRSIATTICYCSTTTTFKYSSLGESSYHSPGYIANLSIVYLTNVESVEIFDKDGWAYQDIYAQ